MRFKRRSKHSWAEIVALCHEAGWETTGNLLAQIGTGYLRPSFKRCEFIATHILKRPALAVELYNFPYRRRAA